MHKLFLVAALSLLPEVAMAIEAGCAPKKVDAAGAASGTDACVAFNPMKALGRGFKRAGATFHGLRLVKTSGRLNPTEATRAAGTQQASSLGVSVGQDGGKSYDLVSWSPAAGVADVTEVFFSKDEHLMAVVFTPLDAAGKAPDTSRSLTGVFDITAPLAARPK